MPARAAFSSSNRFTSASVSGSRSANSSSTATVKSVPLSNASRALREQLVRAYGLHPLKRERYSKRLQQALRDALPRPALHRDARVPRLPSSRRSSAGSASRSWSFSASSTESPCREAASSRCRSAGTRPRAPRRPPPGPSDARRAAGSPRPPPRPPPCRTPRGRSTARRRRRRAGSGGRGGGARAAR